MRGHKSKEDTGHRKGRRKRERSRSFLLITCVVTNQKHGTRVKKERKKKSKCRKKEGWLLFYAYRFCRVAAASFSPQEG
jgi:hypothetical protein